MDGKNLPISKEKWSNGIKRFNPSTRFSDFLSTSKEPRDPVNDVFPLYSIQQPVRTTIQFSLHDWCRTHAQVLFKFRLLHLRHRIFTRHC